MENIPKTGYFTQKYKLILLFIHIIILHLITCKKKNTQKTIQNKCLSLILKIWCQWLQFCCCLLKVEQSFLWKSFFHISGNHMSDQNISIFSYINISILFWCPMVCEENIEILILNRTQRNNGQQVHVKGKSPWALFSSQTNKKMEHTIAFFTQETKQVILYDLSAQ